MLVEHHMNVFIDVVDNLIDEKELKELCKMVQECPYHFGITDDPKGPPSGMGCWLINPLTPTPLYNNSYLHNFVHSIVAKLGSMDKYGYMKDYKIERVGINLFFPRETPSFHKDIPNGLTILVYCSNTFDISEQGETQFLIYNSNENLEIKGVLPKPGRVVLFSGSISHRATSYRNNHRFTLAIQMKNYECL